MFLPGPSIAYSMIAITVGKGSSTIPWDQPHDIPQVGLTYSVSILKLYSNAH